MPPLNMTTRRGEVIGLDVDLARAMAEALKVKLRLATMPFPDLLPALEAGTVDAIISGMTITPERSLRATFVGPYFVSGKSLLAKADGLVPGKAPAELNDPGIRLAALRDSTSQSFVEQVMPRARLVLIQSYDEGTALVLQDTVDAMVADFPVCVFSVFRYPDRGLYALVTPLNQEPLGNRPAQERSRRWRRGPAPGYRVSRPAAPWTGCAIAGSRTPPGSVSCRDAAPRGWGGTAMTVRRLVARLFVSRVQRAGARGPGRGGLLGATLGAASAQAPSVRFAVIGDYGLADVPAAAVATLVKSWNPDFIITTGDNNYYYGAASTIDRNVGQYYHAFIHPYQGGYGPGASVNRFFPTLGNHDWEAPGAQPYLDYFTLARQRALLRRSCKGRFTSSPWTATPPSPTGSSATSVQATWLQARLAASTAPWKIVYFHHPAYSSGHHGSAACDAVAVRGVGGRRGPRRPRPPLRAHHPRRLPLLHQRSRGRVALRIRSCPSRGARCGSTTTSGRCWSRPAPRVSPSSSSPGPAWSIDRYTLYATPERAPPGRPQPPSGHTRLGARDSPRLEGQRQQREWRQAGAPG